MLENLVLVVGAEGVSGLIPGLRADTLEGGRVFALLVGGRTRPELLAPLDGGRTVVPVRAVVAVDGLDVAGGLDVAEGLLEVAGGRGAGDGVRGAGEGLRGAGDGGFGGDGDASTLCNVSAHAGELEHATMTPVARKEAKTPPAALRINFILCCLPSFRNDFRIFVVVDDVDTDCINVLAGEVLHFGKQQSTLVTLFIPPDIVPGQATGFIEQARLCLVENVAGDGMAVSPVPGDQGVIVLVVEVQMDYHNFPSTTKVVEGVRCSEPRMVA